MEFVVVVVVVAQKICQAAKKEDVVYTGVVPKCLLSDQSANPGDFCRYAISDSFLIIRSGTRALV